jgi:hypothetical protein
MVEENVKEPIIKTIAILPVTHAKLMSIKTELKIIKMNELIEKLIKEFEENRK